MTGPIRIDLHVHTRDRSPCGISPEQEQVEAGIRAGLGAIAFCDHDRLAPAERLAELNARYAPFRIFGGVEVGVEEDHHILVLGVQDPVIEQTDWSYPALHDFVRGHGGFLAVAHPLRYRPQIELDLERYRPDALEICSTNVTVFDTPRLRDIADRQGLGQLSNSDAHEARNIGRFFNVLQAAPADDGDLVAMLRERRFTCHLPPDYR